MKLSPKKILETKFDPVINGYSPTKVDQFLDLIIEDYEQMIKENQQLKESVENLEAQVKLQKEELERLKLLNQANQANEIAEELTQEESDINPEPNES